MANVLEYAIVLKDGFTSVAGKVKTGAADIGAGIDKMAKSASTAMQGIQGDFSKFGDLVGGLGGPVAAMFVSTFEAFDPDTGKFTGEMPAKVMAVWDEYAETKRKGYGVR